jgi:catechol 2,3-dioxygenase-like lactoylglutathione lyase family enzyme
MLYNYNHSINTMTEQSDQPLQKFSVEEAMSITVYVDHFGIAHDFYTRVLGLKVSGELDNASCFLYLGDNPHGIYLEGGHTRQRVDEGSSRVSCMLSVDSALNLYKKLISESARVVQDEPKQMGENAFWFQFYDPAGNLLEAVGGA